ncbi:MAG: AarF/UbiB family protein, partial [Mangrovicoccus sp.]|nr:AarF/UbiB family protein [Mangrovicoccus sp.]
LPTGLDLGPLLREAKRQLHEETDYQREAQNLARFGKFLGDDPGFHVPGYHPDLSQAHILVMDFAPGHAIEDLAQAGQSLRDSIASRLIDLTLQELFCFGWMQTDPNFANYLYDPATDRIVLLDFGAARPVPAPMARAYARLLRLGLSAPQPPEPNAMAHALEALGVWGAATPARHKAVMLQMAGKLFEHLRAPGPFDFATNRLHQDLHELGMEIAQDRRIDHIPPIEMLYIQRKLAGMFLLATRLKARVDLHALIAKRLPPADAPLGAE